MGQMFCQPSSIWCSKYVLLLFSFECPKPIRNYEKTNTWKIKRLVDDSFVSSAKQTSVSYSRLTDFFVYTLPTQFIKALLWLVVLCLVFKCAKISEFLKYFEILVITNSFWAETCPGEKTWIGSWKNGHYVKAPMRTEEQNHFWKSSFSTPSTQIFFQSGSLKKVVCHTYKSGKSQVGTL